MGGFSGDDKLPYYHNGNGLETKNIAKQTKY
jgi:hypothetical protein